MTEPLHILVIDDDASMRHMLRTMLERAGYQVSEAEDGRAGLQHLKEDPADIVLCDVRMPVLGGMDFLQAQAEIPHDATLIMMTAYGSLDLAMECLKLGAYDYLSKPFKPDEVVLTLKKAQERLGLKRENKRLRAALDTQKPSHELVFRSEAMAQVMRLVTQVAPASSPVLISGETGTGIELVARALHRRSSRAKGPFLSLNCGAIPAGLIESELFGHVRGAFTGAARDHQGMFPAAHGGTLFLDEIAELPLELQPKLLRVLQEKEIRRVGETRSRAVDVRILAATAVDLKQAVEAGSFREDLYYRLNVVDIHLPALRERREDIAPLVSHFLEHHARREKRQPPEMERDAMDRLESYDWPGNVRELGNFIERTLIFCRSPRIGLKDLPWEVRRRNRDEMDDLSLKNAISRMEREFIRRALTRTNGNRTHAAELLDISLRALLYKIKEYDLQE
jgi:two-component system response regulator AtoC